MADGHTADFYVQHPIHGQRFRPEITSVIDVRTRRLVGWSAGLVEATEGTIDAARHAFTTAGVCEEWYVDRGKGFNNRVLDQMFALLDVEKTNSLPYNSQARGVVERLHRTVWVDGGRFLPTFVGKDMDAEAAKRVLKKVDKDIKATGGSPLLMSWTAFLAWAQEQVDRYNNHEHSSLDKVPGESRRMSPNETWAVAAQGLDIRVEDPNDPSLWRPRDKRTVSRGEVDLLTNVYFSPALEAHHGEKVSVAYDIHDPQTVWVSTLDGRFICEAKFFANKSGYRAVSSSEKSKERRNTGQLKRLDKHKDRIMAERDAVTLDLQASQPAAPALSAEEAEAMREKIAQLGKPRTPEAPAATGDVPNFPDGVEGHLQFIRWLMANPGQATEPRIKSARDFMQSRGAPRLMQAYGFEIEAAARFLSDQSNTLGNKEEATRHEASVL